MTCSVVFNRYDAARIVTGETPDCSHREIMQAWQTLVDTGHIREMGEWYQEMANALIGSGKIRGFDGT